MIRKLVKRKQKMAIQLYAPRSCKAVIFGGAMSKSLISARKKTVYFGFIISVYNERVKTSDHIRCDYYYYLDA